MSAEPDAAFRDLYARHFDAVLGFALRRCDRPEDAADVTAETFVVAWRRLRHVPAGDGTRPWLYGVARRVLANQRRGEGRRAALGARLRTQVESAMRDSRRQGAARPPAGHRLHARHRGMIWASRAAASSIGCRP